MTIAIVSDTVQNRALVVVLLGVSAAVGPGCRSSAAAPDGGVEADGDAGPGPDATTRGRRSFDVVARLTPQLDGGAGVPFEGAFPATNAFTLVIDEDGGWVLGGGEGQAAFAPVTTSDGLTFRATRGFPVGIAGASCEGLVGVAYDTLDFTVNGSTLTGRATGAAMSSCGDCSFSEGFTAELLGAADVSAPIVTSDSTVVTDPFETFFVAASEPLPATAAAHLVDEAGNMTALQPVPLTAPPTSAPAFEVPDLPTIIGFEKPNVVLPPGESYAITADGLVDFAGNSDPTGIPLRFAVIAPAPLVPADGFESATGATLGGATVVTTGGPLAPITGTHSLYFGASGAPTVGTVAPGTRFLVRLALQAGDTVVRFAFRAVSMTGEVSAGEASIGSVGGQIATMPLPPAAPEPELVVGVGFESPVQTVTVPLPADATGEVVFGISTTTASCGLPVPPAGVLIDDLRAE